MTNIISGKTISRRTLIAALGMASAMNLVGCSTIPRTAKRASYPFVDGLCTIPDFTKYPNALADSGLTAFFLDISQAERVPTQDGSVLFHRSYEAALRSVVKKRQQIENADGAFIATRGSQIAEAYEDGRTAIFFQCQGCEPLGEDIRRLDVLYELGLRILQLTHHDNNYFAGGALQSTPSGLTPLGFEGIERMNELRVIPDLSHASDMTSLDVLKASKSPVILSHGAARSLLRNARCAPDEVIRGVGESGGVMGIFMISFWLTNDPVPTVDHVVRHIRHVENIAGTDAVGIGNDFSVTGHEPTAMIGNNNAEAAKRNYPWWETLRARGTLGFDELPKHYVVPELNNVHRMFTIQEALEKAGFSSGRIEKILGGNWARVLTEVLG